MQTTQKNTKSQTIQKQKSLETINEFGSSLSSATARSMKDVGNSMRDVGTGIFDQLFGINDSYNPSERFSPHESTEQKPNRPPSLNKMTERTGLFSYQEMQEKQQIEYYRQQIKKQIEIIKNRNNVLMSELKDVENMTIENAPEKMGVYHLRFLEVIMQLLQTISKKMGESNTWLDAMTSKRKKRGSLFMTRSKKAGTQYSMSEELKLARSGQ